MISGSWGSIGSGSGSGSCMVMGSGGKSWIVAFWI